MKLPTFSGSFLIIFIVVFTPKAEAAVKFPQERVLQSTRGHVEKIVGGNPADIGQFPYMGGLVYSGGQYCGCVIIDQWWVLTAAHCNVWLTDWVVVGTNYIDVNQNAGVETYDPEVQKIFIQQVIKHENYTTNGFGYDIALVRLKTPITFNNCTKSIQYSRGSVLTGDSNVKVSGWGATQYGATQYSKILRYVDLTSVTNDECQTAYSSLAPNAIDGTMMCAYAPGKDGCQGDAGGPLVYMNELVGLSSWGYGCAEPGYPGVYTNVGTFYDWIKSTMNNYMNQ